MFLIFEDIFYISQKLLLRTTYFVVFMGVKHKPQGDAEGGKLRSCAFKRVKLLFVRSPQQSIVISHCQDAAAHLPIKLLSVDQKLLRSPTEQYL